MRFFICNYLKEITKSRFEAIVTPHGRSKNFVDAMKKHSRTSPEIKSRRLRETKMNINRQMSEELLLNDRRGNLIHGL